MKSLGLAELLSKKNNFFIHPLYFLADVSHPETIEFKKQYEHDRQKIEEMMKTPHFMDKVLQRLTE